MHRSLAAKIKKLDRRHIPDLLPEKTENIAKITSALRRFFFAAIICAWLFLRR